MSTVYRFARSLLHGAEPGKNPIWTCGTWPPYANRVGHNRTVRGFGIDRRCGDKALKRGVVMVTDLMCEVVVAHDRYTDSNRVQQADWNAIIRNIVFPEPGHLRSRKVVSRARARPTGKYPSWKMRRMVQWESENELNAFRLLDCDPDVTRFIEQPCEVMYVLDGKVRSHFPDIFVEKNGRKELWEVKPESRAEKPEFVARTALLTLGLPLGGSTYGVVLAKAFSRQPRK